jgi:dihydrofolate reductase
MWFMRRLVVIEFLSVDGVMQGLGSPDEDTDGGFTHGGWGAPYAPALHEATTGIDSTSAYLFGRRTYEKLAAFWPHQSDDNPMARHLNQSPKHVATRTLTELTWQGSIVLDGELGSAVTPLKASGDGDIAVLGSGVLVHELMQRGLVDEFRLFIHPLLLGTGKRLFRGLPEPQRLRLESQSATSAGTVVVRYSVK